MTHFSIRVPGLIPDLTTKEELNEWERQNILDAFAWGVPGRASSDITTKWFCVARSVDLHFATPTNMEPLSCYVSVGEVPPYSRLAERWRDDEQNDTVSQVEFHYGTSRCRLFTSSNKGRNEHLDFR